MVAAYMRAIPSPKISLLSAMMSHGLIPMRNSVRVSAATARCFGTVNILVSSAAGG